MYLRSTVVARPVARAPRAAARRAPQRTADDYYTPRSIDNSRLVKAADPRERSEQTRLVVLALALAVAMLGTAWQRFAMIRAGYRLEALKIEREQLIESNRDRKSVV